jgi:hypothetical protein
MMGVSAEVRMTRGIRSAMIRWAVAGAGALALVGAAVAQEPPAFRKGLWEFTRTVEGTGQPKNTVARKVYTSPCTLQNGKITSKQVLTAQADSAYTVQIDSSGVVGGQTVTTKEELIARRLGDCP